MKQVKWLALASLVMLAACKSSHITSTWKAKSTTESRYNKILVLGLIREDDRRLQEKMEDHMAGDLKMLGYQAVTSVAEYGPKAFENLSESEALAKLKNSDIDAVITIVLVNKTVEKDFVPTNPRPHRNFVYFGGTRQPYYRFWNYYGAVKNRVFEPGYYVDNTKYLWESNLYELGRQSLVFSVQTKSFNPASIESMGHEYGKMIIRSMEAKKVLKKQTDEPKKGF